MTDATSSLAGKRIVVTRAADQAGHLDELLRSRGADPLPYPCIAIAPPESTGPLDDAMCDLAAGQFDWLVLTSCNAVSVLADRLRALNIGQLEAGRFRVAVVGAATAAAVKDDLHLTVDLVPDQFVAESLAESLLQQTADGQRILLCQAGIARPVLVDVLLAGGADVTAVVAYRTVVGSGGVDLPGILRARRIDAITFTSSSTVKNLLRRLDAEGGRRDDLAGVCLACIGPVTAETAAKQGLAVQVVPAEHTVPSLVEALETYFAAARGAPLANYYTTELSHRQTQP